MAGEEFPNSGATRLRRLTVHFSDLPALLNPFIEVVFPMEDFLTSVAAGLDEARNGIVQYASSSYLASELEDIWNPQPLVEEEDKRYSISAAPALEGEVLLRKPQRVRAALPKRPPPWFVGMSSAFSKEIVNIDRKLQGRILEALVEITENPTEMRGDTVKSLVGDLKGCWRYRVGDYRIIYSPDRNTGDITLLAFDARGSAYAV